MTKHEFDFETWFDSLNAMILDRGGEELRDEEVAREYYDRGRNCADVADEIANEYLD